VSIPWLLRNVIGDLCELYGAQVVPGDGIEPSRPIRDPGF
jgi:hypothetical protein